jgi:hypothetical protein
MGTEALIYARPEAPSSDQKASTGIIQDARDEVDLPTHPWGTGESFPDYIKITITDAVVEDIDQWLVPTFNDFFYEILSQTSQARAQSGVRYKINVLPQVQQRWPQAYTQDVLDHMIATYNATVQQYQSQIGSATYLIPTADFDESIIQADLLDRFKSQLALRRYRMTDATVNQGNANNGFLTMDLADFNSRVLDSLI